MYIFGIAQQNTKLNRIKLYINRYIYNYRRWKLFLPHNIYFFSIGIHTFIIITHTHMCIIIKKKKMCARRILKKKKLCDAFNFILSLSLGRVVYICFSRHHRSRRRTRGFSLIIFFFIFRYKKLAISHRGRARASRTQLNRDIESRAARSNNSTANRLSRAVVLLVCALQAFYLFFVVGKRERIIYNSTKPVHYIKKIYIFKKCVFVCSDGANSYFFFLLLLLLLLPRSKLFVYTFQRRI